MFNFSTEKIKRWKHKIIHNNNDSEGRNSKNDFSNSISCYNVVGKDNLIIERANNFHTLSSSDSAKSVSIRKDKIKKYLGATQTKTDDIAAKYLSN
jgi:hypothetical protein